MTRPLVILCLALLLGGCLNSYEEEYRATLHELEQTREALAQAQQKLNAVDAEARQNIIALARRINHQLQAGELAPASLEQLVETMRLQLARYAPLAGQDDRTSTLARFYQQRTEAIADLTRRRDLAYQHQYQGCLEELNKASDTDQLGALLCEVQAELAQREHQADLQASIKALTRVGDELLQVRNETTAPATLAQLQTRFENTIARIKNPAKD